MPPTTPNSSVRPDGETLVSVADHRGKHALRLALTAMHRSIRISPLTCDHVVAEEYPQLPRIASLANEALHIVLLASLSGRVCHCAGRIHWHSISKRAGEPEEPLRKAALTWAHVGTPYGI